LREEVLARMRLWFIRFPNIINRIVYTQNTRLYPQPGGKERKRER
jgi:hypothetical protein